MSETRLQITNRARMIEARLAPIQPRERVRWFLIVDFAFCLVRATFSLEQTCESFRGSSGETVGVLISTALVVATALAAILTTKRKPAGPRLGRVAVYLVILSIGSELQWTWAHLYSGTYGGLLATCSLVPVRFVWAGIYAEALHRARDAA